MPCTVKGSLYKGICDRLDKNMRHSQGEDIYKKNAFCRHCNVFFLKTYLTPNKNGAKVMCPCCHVNARITPSSSAKNRTKQRRNKAVTFKFDMMEK